MPGWGNDPGESEQAASTAFDLALADLDEQEHHPTAGAGTWLRVTFSDGTTSGVSLDSTAALLLDVASHLTPLDGDNVEHVTLTSTSLAFYRTRRDDVVRPVDVDAPNDPRALDDDPQRAIITVIATRLTAAVLVLPFAHFDDGGGSVLAIPEDLPRYGVDEIARSSYRPIVLALVQAFDDDVRDAARERLHR